MTYVVSESCIRCVYTDCVGVRVLAPNLATQPRDLTYSSRQILDLQFQARLRQDLQGDHLMQFKVLTPGGFLYQVLTVPFVGTAPAPDASTRAANARSGAATRAPGPPPPRVVPGYPRPLPVQRLVPTTGDTRTRVYYSVNAALPVAGTSITLSSLYGPWTVATSQGTGRGYNRYTHRFARSLRTRRSPIPEPQH